jgi:AbrB family looped-hinge helix DNA binding protein
MDVETVRISSKGQIVIPQNIREALGMDEGDVLAVTSINDKIVLTKIEIPDREDLIREITALSKRSRKNLEAKGFTEKKIIKKSIT